MGIHRLVISFAGAVLALTLSTPARAQTSDATPVVGVGFAMMHTGRNAPGVAGSIAVPFRELSSGRISIVGDVGFNHFDNFTSMSFFGGARYSMSMASGSPLEPFVQAGVGILHQSAESFVESGTSHFGFAAGAGVRYQFEPTMGALAEIDLGRASYGGFSFNGFRLLVGVTFALGKS